MTSALVAEDTVYFGDLGGWFYALDRETGRGALAGRCAGERLPRCPCRSTCSSASPILADGKIIAGGGALEQLLSGGIFYRGSTGRGFLVALEPKTGKIAWKYRPRAQARAPQPADHDQG